MLRTLALRVGTTFLLAVSIVFWNGCGGSAGSGTSGSGTTTTTTLAASVTSTTVGNSITLTATVSPAAATGTVIFYSGSTELGSSTLSSGTATLTWTPSAAGSYSVTASYGGSSTYASSTSSATSITVTSNSTTTTLTASASSISAGNTVTLTAAVVSSSATGTVDFYQGSTKLGSSTLSSGTATYTTSALSTAGSYTFYAVYEGNSTYASSTSSTIAITVTASSGTTTTTTTLTASSSSITAGNTVTLTAAVTSSSATGTVEFFEGSTELGTATLSSGTATYTTSALSTAGSYTFYAVYLGNSTYASSTSSTITVTVTSSSSSGTATTTTLSIAPSSKAWVNSMVVMTATVASSSATGTVQFWGATSSSGTYSELATATLSSGSATAVTSFSSTRTEFIYAVYVGDSTYASSTSSTSSLTIATPSDSLDFSTYSCTSKSASITTYSSASDTTGTTQTVTYCLYSNVIYAANPDNSSYESMSVYVPTKIGSTSVSVSSSSTPILIENCIGGYMGCTAGSLGTNGDYFLANGYVVVEVGARGRNVADSSGVYGVAPAGIVDLKAAVRFIRHNSASDSGSGSFPGDTDLIFSSGGSAGGAMSSLLGASGNSTLYYSYLAAIGAANANDNVYAVIAYSPITNLDHADMAYEYEYGSLLSSSCSSISSSLQGDFETYQNDLGFSGSSHSSAHSTSSYPYGSTTTYSTLTSSSITPYLLNTYLIPSAEMYLASLSSSSRTSYLSSNSWITYTSSSGAASFTFANYVADGIGTRSKAVPAFDSFYGYSSALSCENTSETAEINEFGDGSSSSAYAHFTDFSSEATGGSAVSTAMQTRVNMMNPMYFITTDITNLANSESTIADVPKFWYIRDGSIATDTSIYVIMDLATGVETLMGNYYSGSTWSVNAWENWGAGHNQNVDPWDLMTWVKSVI